MPFLFLLINIAASYINLILYLSRIKLYTPNVVYKTIDITFLNEIAAANQGIGISIDYVARPFLGSNTVLRYFEDEDCTWDSMMITKKNKPIGVAKQIFIDYALEYVKKHNFN